jgi:hypothetical protein
VVDGSRLESRAGTGTAAAAKMRSTMSVTAFAVALALRLGGSQSRSPFKNSIEKSSGTPAKSATSVSAYDPAAGTDGGTTTARAPAKHVSLWPPNMPHAPW